MSVGMDLLVTAADRGSFSNNFMRSSSFLSSSKYMARSCSNSSLPPKKRMRLSLDLDLGCRGYSANSGCGMPSANGNLNCVGSNSSLSTLGTSVASGSSNSSMDMGMCMGSLLLGRLGASSNAPSGRDSVYTNLWNSEWAAAESMRPRMKRVDLLGLCDDSRGPLTLPKKRSKNLLDLSGCNGPLALPKRGRKSRKTRQVSDASLAEKGSAAAKKKNPALEVKDLDGNDMCMGYFSMASKPASPKREENESEKKEEKESESP